MKAVVFEQFGEPADVLEARDLAEPQPQAGEVLVRMLTAPVNPSDMMTIRGVYPRLPELPAVPGYEGVGIVESSGGGLLGKFMTGKRVAVGHRMGGTWAEKCTLPAKQIVPLPKGIADDQGAMFLVNPVTAYVMSCRVLNVPSGDWLLQTAAGSSLGRMIIRLGRRFGFRTLNVVRRKEQQEELKSLGGDAVVVFDPKQHEPNKLRDEVSQLTGGEGVRFAIDPVGGATATAAVRCLGKNGRMLVFGSLSGEPISFDVRALITPGATVEGFWLTNYFDTLGLLGKLGLVKKVGKLIREGVLTSEIGESFELDQIREAVKKSEESGRGGKVLLRIAQA